MRQLQEVQEQHECPMTSVYCASFPQHCGTFGANAPHCSIALSPPTERKTRCTLPTRPQEAVRRAVTGRNPTDCTHALSSHGISDQARLWEPMSYRESRSSAIRRGGSCACGCYLDSCLEPMVACTQLVVFPLGLVPAGANTCQDQSRSEPQYPSLLIHLGFVIIEHQGTVRVEPRHGTSTAHRRHVDKRYSSRAIN